METDFISRSEALYCNLKVEINSRMNGKSIVEEAIQVYADYISKIPAADVVEVIRCKDCKWFNHIGCAISIVDETDKPKENDFCSFAERKENET